MNRNSRRDLFLVTFSILSLELAVIRWMAQQITLFAYLGSVLLIGAFLGMGLGVAIGRRRPKLFRFTLPALAALSAVLAFSEKLHILHTRFPGKAVAMWGMDGAKNFASSLAIIVVLFAAVVVVFLLAGTRVGEIFAGSDALDAYSVDLAGSFAGVVAMALASAAQTPPPVWFALGGIPLAWLSRRWTGWAALAAVLVFTALSMNGAIFSPYYRIDLDRAANVSGAPLRLSVNRDFHQYAHDFSARHLNDPALSPTEKAVLRSAELSYRLPFALPPRRDNALVVGAGTGNDVAAALRQASAGSSPSTSTRASSRSAGISIPNGRIRIRARVAGGQRCPGVFRETDEQFDVVDFGLLDSHAVFSAMSSLRLDNYVYTVESMRSAWRHVKTPGLMSISFSTGDREWLRTGSTKSSATRRALSRSSFRTRSSTAACTSLPRGSPRATLPRVSAFRRCRRPTRQASRPPPTTGRSCI